MYFKKSTLAILSLILTNYAYANSTAGQCIQQFNDAEFAKAKVSCQQAADQGDSASQTVLGEMYDVGDGVHSDQKMATKWWKMAAGNSYLPAQNLLAMKYYYGGDIFQQQPDWDQNYSKAFEIWKQSAFKSEVTSQFMLGEMYKNGQGVKTDYAESYAWFKIALEGGYKLATDSLIELSRVISPGQKQLGIVRINDLKSEILEKGIR